MNPDDHHWRSSLAKKQHDMLIAVSGLDEKVDGLTSGTERRLRALEGSLDEIKTLLRQR